MALFCHLNVLIETRHEGGEVNICDIFLLKLLKTFQNTETSPFLYLILLSAILQGPPMGILCQKGFI